ncbi:ubiquitinyl hydrolase 1 [Teladorsagia circumcincta]|uniref:ubiquitinyl hydrolase 1 n=1 Tax=Teladorsagia circumcincta TaxID=45464 RepID=A0A2G9V081_TELCI|nr:ubiquitinyl hydrolase 1 [Teladorsagia circumcincta]
MSRDESSNSDSDSATDTKESKNANHAEEGPVKRERSDDQEKSASPPAKKAKDESNDIKPSKKSKDDEKDGASKATESRRSTKAKEKRDDDKKKSKSDKDKEKEREKDKRSRKERSRSRSRSPDTKRRKSDKEKGKGKDRKKDSHSDRKEKSKREKEQADDDERRNGDLEEGEGRGTNTHAYTHSLDTDHRVFLNLHTLKFYCLPDNYEVDDPSLEDIKYVLKPTYTKELIASLDRQHRMARAYDDLTYFPGVVGLNNIKANDYTNVVLHALSHVTPLRDYFLREENYENIKRPPGDKLSLLPKRFGELIRKLWNPKAFRTHVSPHEMLQATVLCSNKKFQFIKQGDAAEFMSFLLNTLHIALNGTQKSSSSIIYRIFRGRMRQYSRRVIPAEATEEQRQQLLQLPEYNGELTGFQFFLILC